MRRRLANVAAALSLLLFVSTAGLWVESYWANRAFDLIIYQRDEPRRPGDILYGPRSAARLTGNSCYGWFHVNFSAYSMQKNMEMPHQPRIRFYYFRKLSEAQRRLDGAKFGARWSSLNRNPGSRGGSFAIVLPYWMPTVLFALCAAWEIRRWRRSLLRSPAEVGKCPTCGYDVRATPERCPECGAVPVGK